MQVEEIFAAIDQDQVGVISYSEFLAATLNQMEYQRKDRLQVRMLVVVVVGRKLLLFLRHTSYVSGRRAKYERRQVVVALHAETYV